MNKLKVKLENGSYTDMNTLMPNENETVGQMLYRVLSGAIAKIVVAKKRGMLKGVDLRQDWRITVEVDGKIALTSANFTGSSDFRLRLGMSDSGVTRFRQSLCEFCVAALWPLYVDETNTFESGYLLSRETIASQVKTVMRMPVSILQPKAAVQETVEQTATA